MSPALFVGETDKPFQSKNSNGPVAGTNSLAFLMAWIPCRQATRIATAEATRHE